MNNRIIAYMVAAVAVGYLLVASLPGQVAMYAAPMSIKGSEDGPLLSEGVPESGNLTAPATSGSEMDQVPGDGVRGPYTESLGYSLYGWWALDLVVALSVYWVARRRFA